MSAATTQFLAWCCERVAAAWRMSKKEVRAWVRTHNRRVKQEGRGVRLVVCQLLI